MDLFWQQVIIGLSLLGAVAYLAQYFFRRSFRKKTPCGSCGLMKVAERKGKAGGISPRRKGSGERRDRKPAG